MVQKDLRRDNDNLAEWRDKRKELTLALLQNAITELESIKAKINQKNVCEMMAKIASKKDIEYKTVITPSAISKNKVLKNIIQEAQAKSKYIDNKGNAIVSDGDKQFEIFKLKAIIAKKEAKIKECESIIKRADIKESPKQITKIPSDQFKLLLKNLIDICLKDQFMYLDKKKNLILEETGEVVISADLILSIKGRS